MSRLTRLIASYGLKATISAILCAGSAVLCAGRLLAASGEVRLIEAVKHGDKAAVDSLLTEKTDVNLPQPDGSTALAWAAHRDDTATAEQLIRAGADVNKTNDYGVTPLALACTNRNAAMIQKLLSAGANPSAKLWNGETVLMTCVRTGSLDGVKLLLARGADVNAKENIEDQTALMWAAATRSSEITRALIERGANVHARSKLIPLPEPFIIKNEQVFGSNYRPTVHFPRSKGGFTPLMFAAREGDLESARLLLEAGANVNEATEEEGSVLIVASASGHEKLAIFLLENGADPNVKDGYGVAPIHYSLHDGLLTLASALKLPTDDLGWERPNMPGLLKALMARGADPNTRIEKNFPNLEYPFLARGGEDHPQIELASATPFMLAAASGDVAAMRTLVEGRADPKVVTSEGVSSLLVASGLGTERGRRDEKGAIEALKLVMALDPNADVNGAAKGGIYGDGRTALHAAAYLGWNDMIKFLAEKGANLDVKDMYGMTPLEIALGDPEGRLYRNLPGGRYDDRFRRPAFRVNKVTSELLVKLGATPFTGKFRERTGE
ncbi:MAG: ankyrin repeat domain-containing protein [Acidobacteria bacterium]|nr:ankyrin repeat domain-containing protein [Acidobacteriota bacterium]